MLVVVDMQNRILDETDECFVPGAQALISPIQQRLKQARANQELVIFTRDIPLAFKNQDEENVALQIIPQLAPLATELILKKYYFTLPPEQLLAIQALPEVAGQKTFELVGTELNLCVLANTLALQSIFPEADFVIVPERVAGRAMTAEALDLLRKFNVEVG